MGLPLPGSPIDKIEAAPRIAKTGLEVAIKVRADRRTAL